MTFLIKVIKVFVCFTAICRGLNVLHLVWAVVREATWHENRKKHEQEDKDNENGSI